MLRIAKRCASRWPGVGDLRAARNLRASNGRGGLVLAIPDDDYGRTGWPFEGSCFLFSFWRCTVCVFPEDQNPREWLPRLGGSGYDRFVVNDAGNTPHHQEMRFRARNPAVEKNVFFEASR